MPKLKFLQQGKHTPAHAALVWKAKALFAFLI
jgi:hypothetical protein